MGDPALNPAPYRLRCGCTPTMVDHLGVV